MTPLQEILTAYRATSQTAREKGTYFEELIRTYFKFEASYAELYSDVWLYADWAAVHGASAKDTGIDLVAKTAGTDEFHAIQCKCYAESYRVRKADIDSKTKDPESGKSVSDKSTVIFNERITLRNIPLAAYHYIVNGKPALEWVMERQAVTTDKASGILNDANLYASETIGDPKYPLELFLRVTTVSLETMKIVNSLPKLEIG